MRVVGNSVREQAGVQSHGKDSGFHSKCGEELLEASGEGDKRFQEITLAAVKRVNCRGKRVGRRRPTESQLQWSVSFHEDHSGFQVGNRL